MPVLDARIEPLERVVDACARVIVAGGSIVFPADTSYYMGCDPYRSPVAREPMELLIATPAEFLEYARSNPLAVLVSRRLFPGPLTAVIRKPAFISANVTAGLPAVGMRVPEDPLARAILERTGPLAAAPVRDRAESSADLVIENGPTHYDREATVVDLTSIHARLVRNGAIGYERLVEVFGPIE